ncbi:MAG: methyltransferase domain-containing protein, partial [Tepidisphaerales bacterium]
TLRQHLSSYAWDHYGEFDPRETGTPRPGLVARLAARAVELAGGNFDGPALDAGCSVGRSTFELAARGRGPVLGVDLSIAMLRLARRVMREGTVRYDRRRLGLLYERREFPVSLPTAARVDFWAADALCLPFADGTFARAMALNLLDCVSSPLDLLRSLHRVTAAGGRFVTGSPYDWLGAAAPPQAWLGGHSPRGFFDGESGRVLRAILTPGRHPVSLDGVRIVADDPAVPWQVRMHERYTAMYTVDVVAAEKC